MSVLYSLKNKYENEILQHKMFLRYANFR